MASIQESQDQPSFNRRSPSPSVSPTPAIGACPEMSRTVSMTSTGSVESTPRLSLGSSTSSVSRSSSAGYTPRQSMGGLEKRGVRGYVRPQGTNFATSAKSRESVLSLGSIAHLQYYFARTGLLDGKGGRLSKKKDNRGTLDLSALDTSFLSPRVLGVDEDSSYASMGSSPELLAQAHVGNMLESPTQEDFGYISEDDGDPHMLPPTTSTYRHREIPEHHPPSLEELKTELHKSLGEAAKVLADVRQNPFSPPASPSSNGDAASPVSSQGWYELQGMHVLDIITLAIRAAKMYYTAHDQPARLAAIKSERQLRAELLSVMEVLKRMATRNFSHEMRTEERITIEQWVEGVYDMLKQEEAIEEDERAQRASWKWLDGSWEDKAIEREYAFMRSMDPDSSTLPEYTPSSSVTDDALPTDFLNDLRTGLRLVSLHNAVVKKSKRQFGTIDKWHTDFGKPYRMAENLRFWIKAAELRWGVTLSVDVMGVVAGTNCAAMQGFEDAVWKWCGKVREEITGELKA
ncbi:hypothetical protein BJ878DRAFT_5592 [Calycina marina]|uniref:Uncharacterized protein n=1 Tax=Calycina marina TaxID=1763456 RepID=A0A9P8CGB4_9HELO|nr:hypothetical protein BJ878DRAFT_5592 [Calycina marina]